MSWQHTHTLRAPNKPFPALIIGWGASFAAFEAYFLDLQFASLAHELAYAQVWHSSATLLRQ